ncbi:MAG TPA: molecular chaperone TorD family protein [Candidatus Binatia bacterium]|nr:molecular chaperone TorD family protein [Candidatus Binatia bacterium]
MKPNDDVRALIAEAAEWRLIGLLLERPRGDWHREVATLLEEVRDKPLRAAATIAVTNEGAYLRLVGPGGVVSPREVGHRSFVDPGQLLARLAAVYDAFAFRPHVEEPVDHIAVEAGFVGYLLLKQAFAAAKGDREDAAMIEKARHAFIATHLGGFVSGFATGVASAGASHLSAAARCLEARVPAQPLLPVGLPADDSVDICGACGIGDSK